MPDLIWTKKKLSKTDAQQKTTGGLVPYLRLTKGNLRNHDYQTWFRDVFFSGLRWRPAKFGKEDVEKCEVLMSITFQGTDLGKIKFDVTHGRDRWRSNNTPNTWVHWPPRLQELLTENNITGAQVTIIRHRDSSYSMRLG